MQLIFQLNAPIGKVYDYLTEADKFVETHPIIHKMEPLTATNMYKVFETVKFGFIPYSFSYKATISGNSEQNQVIIFASISRLTKIEMIFNLISTASGCQVEENILFNSPLPIKSFMKKLFAKQHQILFENIEKA